MIFNPILVFLLTNIVTSEYTLSSYAEKQLKQQGQSTCLISKCYQMNLDFVELSQSSCSSLISNHNISVAHYEVEVFADLILLGQWQNDSIQLSVDNHVIENRYYTYNQSRSGQYCRLQITNGLMTLKQSVHHYKKDLKLEFKLIQQNGLDILLGIRNIYIKVKECHASCQTCSGPLSTDCRTCPTDGILNRRNNQCRCPNNKQYIYEQACVTICPRMYTSDHLSVCIFNTQLSMFHENFITSAKFNGYQIARMGYILENIKDNKLIMFQNSPCIGMMQSMDILKISLQNLPKHVSVLVRFKIYAFFIWGADEYISVKVGNVQQPVIQLTNIGFTNVQSQSSCQSNEMQHCTSLVNEFIVSHTLDSISIEIYSDNYPLSQARWVITQITIHTIQCTINCDVCMSNIQCKQCLPKYFNYKGTCLSECPSSATILNEQCIDFDEVVQYSSYLLYAFTDVHIPYWESSILTLSNKPQYGYYFEGTRIYGGITTTDNGLYGNSHVGSTFQQLPPHYAIRQNCDIILFNIQNNHGQVMLKNGQIFESNGNQTVQTRQYKDTMLHNSTNFIVSFTQIENIPDSYFRFGIRNLWVAIDQCYPYCLLCNGSQIENCQQWKLDVKFDQQSHQCIQGYYYNATTYECEQCGFGCDSCQSLYSCNKCSDGFIQSGHMCYCDIGYYQVDNICQSCNDGCRLCNGPLMGDCYELQMVVGNCNDNVWTPGEQCDDGNAIDKDGCSNCKIDRSWSCDNIENTPSSCFKCPLNCQQCIRITNMNTIATKCVGCEQGYFEYQGICDKCPINCKVCSSKSQCLECNIKTNLPKNGYCQGCNNQIGYYESDYKCVSKCGDGILTQDEQCDDGNLIDNDGCNQYCQVESKYICDSLGCQLTPEPLVTLEYKNRTTTNDLELKMDDNQLNCDSITVWIEQFNPADFVAYFNKKQSSDGVLCEIQFKFYRDVQDYDVIHVIIGNTANTTTRQLQDSQNIDSNSREIIIKARKQVYYSDEQQQDAKNVQQVQEAFTMSLFVIGPATILLGGFKFFFSILDILAWLNNLYYMNVEYPANVKTLFQNAAWGDFDMLQPPTFMNRPSDDYYIESPLKFDEKGVDPLFLNNTWMCFTIWALCIILFPMAKLLVNCIHHIMGNKQQVKVVPIKPIFDVSSLDQSGFNITQSSPPQRKRSISKQYPYLIEKVYETALEYQKSFKSIMIKQLNLTYLDLCMASILQIMYIWQISHIVIFINIVLACIGFVFCLAVILLAFGVAMKHQGILEHRIFKYDYGTLYEGIDTANKAARMYFAINLVRKILYILFVVAFYYQPIIQTALCCMASFLNTTMLIYNNPFESKIDFYQNGIPDACIFLMMFMCVGLAIDDKINYFTTNGRCNMGWVIITIISISIITQLIFLLREFAIQFMDNVKTVVQYFKKPKEFTL